MKKIIILIACVLTASCASVRPGTATNYELSLVAPEETKNFVLTARKVFDEPMLGTMLEYTNKQYPDDNIDLYIYPIDHYDWEDAENTLKREMDKVIAEIDSAVEYGYYASRTEESRETFGVPQGEKTFNGLKSSFELKSKDEVTYHSNAYVFMQKDKFIKFRTSFDSRATVPWSGDQSVAEILPELIVPDESEYMKELRIAHRQQVTANIMKLLIQAAKQGGATSD
ncbi:hypothetical protein [Microbulbifer magnicolonia]|uniref:hypothetical protein n=1 Tax=Microbulbifer magnicolonia TaxID=3109744 RepID=UPI002B4116BF|nr:hypothetical protein [Microbulbifer sp. GG15]